MLTEQLSFQRLRSTLHSQKTSSRSSVSNSDPSNPELLQNRQASLGCSRASCRQRDRNLGLSKIPRPSSVDVARASRPRLGKNRRSEISSDSQTVLSRVTALPCMRAIRARLRSISRCILRDGEWTCSMSRSTQKGRSRRAVRRMDPKESGRRARAGSTRVLQAQTAGPLALPRRIPMDPTNRPNSAAARTTRTCASSTTMFQPCDGSWSLCELRPFTRLRR